MTGITSTNSAAPIVLIADDLPRVISTWTHHLASYGIGVVVATSLEELHSVYAQHQSHIAAVILDGCIPGHFVNTIGFIRAARANGFTKPIVAASSLPEYRAQMVGAGCSHQAPKELAADLVADLLSAP
jgi:CheY-like chemotaxis protein